jgi:pSer/pThr/pTyr-binding forkhead associated (FHA) protein
MMGSAGQAIIEEPCPACETTMPAGEDFCPKCGYQRGTWQGTSAATESATSEGSTPSVATATGPELWTLFSEGNSWKLSAATYVIGRGEVDIRIEDGYASRRHAQLDVTAENVTLTDLGSSNGTFLGERRLDANLPEQLGPEDSFRIANTSFTLEQPADAESATVAAGGQEVAEPGGINTMEADNQGALQTDSEGTVIDEGSQLTDDQPVQERFEPSASHWELRRANETIEVVMGEMTLGRKEAASRIVEGDSYISGCHCRLIASEDTLEIIDLHSTNGTYVNDARLDPEQPWKLQTGDKLRIGQTTFEVIDNKPAITEGQELEQREPSE